jgi:hypothetical protein
MDETGAGNEGWAGLGCVGWEWVVSGLCWSVARGIEDDDDGDGDGDGDGMDGARVLWGPTANGCLAGPPAPTTLRLRDATLGWFAAGAVGQAVGRTVGRPWGVGLGQVGQGRASRWSAPPSAVHHGYRLQTAVQPGSEGRRGSEGQRMFHAGRGCWPWMLSSTQPCPSSTHPRATASTGLSLFSLPLPSTLDTDICLRLRLRLVASLAPI